MTRSKPVGPEQPLLVLAGAMRRAALAVTVAAGAPTVVVAGVLAGWPGAASALVGVLLGLVASLFTLWVMRRTAGRDPRFVMIASFGGLLQKSIFLLAALLVVATVPGVHRLAMAVGLLVTLVGTAGAEGWAGYRLRSVVVEPVGTAPTSGSTTGPVGSPTGGPTEPAGRPVGAPERSDRDA